MERSIKNYFPPRMTTCKRKNISNGESVSKKLKIACVSGSLNKLQQFTRQNGQEEDEGKQFEVITSSSFETEAHDQQQLSTPAPPISPSLDLHTVSNSLETIGSCSSGARIDERTASTASVKYTPLEEQYISIKSQHKDTILLIECGYKYKFFGEDAQIASKILNIGCFMDHNFPTASIPVHRLNVHVQRLVSEGLKVGVVNQTETAVQKANSGKRSGPFSRELTALYTKTTFNIDSQEIREDTNDDHFMMSIYSNCTGNKSCTFGFVAVQPLLGNVVYEEFTDDTKLLSNVESRLAHINPSEILYSANEQNKALLDMLVRWKKQRGCGARLEEVPGKWLEYSEALPAVTNFYSNKTTTTITTGIDGPSCSKPAEDSDCDLVILEKILKLPQLVLCCLSCIIQHLSLFKLENILRVSNNIRPYSSGGFYLHLNKSTLNNLEIFLNQSTKSSKGSLFWILDHTHTQFGQRMLKQWLLYPLTDIKQIQERQDAIKNLLSNEQCYKILSRTLKQQQDLERLLCSCYQHHCKPSMFITMVQSLIDIEDTLSMTSDMVIEGMDSTLLGMIFDEVPKCFHGLQSFLSILDLKAAKDCVYEDLFNDLTEFPDIKKEKEGITKNETAIEKFKASICKIVPGFKDYHSVSGIKYLVEVKNNSLNKVPTDWSLVNRTKSVTRFHPGFVSDALRAISQYRDTLAIVAKKAWLKLLKDFNSDKYESIKRGIDLLAVSDCLLSLYDVAKAHGYIRPVIVDERCLQIRNGRHPILEVALNNKQYVPNHTDLTDSGLNTMIITGPNMGGKSSYIRQVALLCIMAQIGSFVPAESAIISPLDAIFTRMGASDNIMANRSTFMTELLETSEILQLATPRSLVVIDELGRGTSTHDGTAIAYATLIHLIEKIKCFCLFVTHYLFLSELETQYKGRVDNYHMSYIQDRNNSDVYDKVVFLYEIIKGSGSGSYGLNVAALAGIPSEVIALAKKKSLLLCNGYLSKRSLTDSEMQFCEIMS